MKTNIIEKLDKRRYDSLKLLTVGIVIIFGAMAWYELAMKTGYIGYPLLAVGITGIVISGIAIYGLVAVKSKINADAALKDALFDEMYVSHAYKSQRHGFWAMYVVLLFFILTSSLYDISVRFACEITMFAGILTMVLSFLKLQKEK